MSAQTCAVSMQACAVCVRTCALSVQRSEVLISVKSLPVLDFRSDSAYC